MFSTRFKVTNFELRCQDGKPKARNGCKYMLGRVLLWRKDNNSRAMPRRHLLKHDRYDIDSENNYARLIFRYGPQSSSFGGQNFKLCCFALQIELYSDGLQGARGLQLYLGTEH